MKRCLTITWFAKEILISLHAGKKRHGNRYLCDRQTQYTTQSSATSQHKSFWEHFGMVFTHHRSTIFVHNLSCFFAVLYFFPAWHLVTSHPDTRTRVLNHWLYKLRTVLSWLHRHNHWRTLAFGARCLPRMLFSWIQIKSDIESKWWIEFVWCAGYELLKKYYITDRYSLSVYVCWGVKM